VCVERVSESGKQGFCVYVCNYACMGGWGQVWGSGSGWEWVGVCWVGMWMCKFYYSLFALVLLSKEKLASLHNSNLENWLLLDKPRFF